MYLEDIILREFSQSQKKSLDMHSLTSGYQPRNIEHPRYNFHNKKIKKKEDQRVDTSFLLRIGNKITMKGVTETKFGAKMKGWTIQRLPHLGIHPIIATKPRHYCICQQDFAEGTLIQLSLMRLCQYLANTEVDAHSHLQDGTQGFQWRSQRKYPRS